MNLEKIHRIAQENMPEISVKILSNTYRYDVISPLSGNSNIGIELGVAQGVFSKMMVKSKKFSEFYGVDMYADHIHNTEEYKVALKSIGLLSNYKLLRMTFDDALDLFDDNFFDFIYIDGFAHTGEEGGVTLEKWYQKLKIGGILAGDDYHMDWPLVMWAVNHFASQIDSEVSLTENIGESEYCQYPSWSLKKEKDIRDFSNSSLLLRSAAEEGQRIQTKRKLMHMLRKIKRSVGL